MLINVKNFFKNIKYSEILCKIFERCFFLNLKQIPLPKHTINAIDNDKLFVDNYIVLKI